MPLLSFTARCTLHGTAARPRVLLADPSPCHAPGRFAGREEGQGLPCPGRRRHAQMLAAPWICAGPGARGRWGHAGAPGSAPSSHPLLSAGGELHRRAPGGAPQLSWIQDCSAGGRGAHGALPGCPKDAGSAHGHGGGPACPAPPGPRYPPACPSKSPAAPGRQVTAAPVNSLLRLGLLPALASPP